MVSDVIDLRNNDISNEVNKPNLSNDFKTYLETAEQIKTLGYNPNAPCIINFYEWSNLSMKRTFNSIESFEQFLKESKITTKFYEDNQIKRMSHQGGVFIICKPECKDLLIEPTYTSLETSFKRATRQFSTPSYNSHLPACCSPVYANMYSRDFDEWDGWD